MSSVDLNNTVGRLWTMVASLTLETTKAPLILFSYEISTHFHRYPLPLSSDHPEMLLDPVLSLKYPFWLLYVPALIKIICF